ncbi:MAG: hypothetical protein Q4E01_06980 [Actinomycetaceae bacterium]|nr:hypothetical protein [Actinomycetaceae bacterium]
MDGENLTIQVLSGPQPRGLGSQYVEADSSRRSERTKRLWIAFAWAIGVLLFLALPTDLIPNPVFGREVPIRWWEYPVVGATVLLTFVWFAIQAPPMEFQKNGRLVGAVTLSLFAVACPVCNKIILLLLGTAGALGVWAPLQPYIAALSVALLALALYLRIRAARKVKTEPAGA